MALDIDKLKLEVEQLGSLDVAVAAADAELSAANNALGVATANQATAADAVAAAGAKLSAQIAYITGLLGVTPPVPDPTPTV